VRRLVAGFGFLLGAVGVVAAVWGEGPVPGWLLRLFAAWCVGTPYWWWLEYRLLRPEGGAARRHFVAEQAFSRWVWLGFTLAMAVPMLLRARAGAAG
jgi:hypothetical protein